MLYLPLVIQNFISDTMKESVIQNSSNEFENYVFHPDPGYFPGKDLNEPELII